MCRLSRLPRALIAAAALAVYAVVLKALAIGVVACVGQSPAALDSHYEAEFVALFVLFFSPLLYGIVWLTRSGPDAAGAKPAATMPGMVCAAGFTFLCAAPLEILVDTAFVAATGQPCWEYRVWPIHRGYTSGVGAAMWPMYGAFVYAFHGAIRSRADLRCLHGLGARAALVAVEAMVLEIAANAFALAVYGTFYFYYLPGDLNHLTTMQILVPYFGAGMLGLTLLEQVERLPYPAAVGVISWVVGFGLLFGAGTL